ncbi:AraC family transcriptional regulator [Aquimarina sp. AU119]|uniref:helix-turn-helix domain-containing protein n=1 Tax=Aquimarina sp. AU119 TaxID=2108528 RepID=UPI000D688FE1|nr:AraC family transcriptional regulator [Aquimarina sp. AU119]
MKILYNGQYLGQTIKSYETDMISVKSTLHEMSKSKFHAHSNSYLSILLSGLYSEVTPVSQKIIYPSNILYRPAYYNHKNQFITDKTKCLNIEFRPEWFDKLDINSQEIKPYIKNIQNHPLILHLLIDFLKHHQIDFFEELLQNIIINEDRVNTPLRKPWLSKLIRILNNETEENHSLKSLSERVFVHPNYMSRVFKEHFGVTIGQYQMDKKVKSATKKLFIDRDSIVQIASDCGFFDESHFIKTFKAFNKITPHQFRMLLK